MIDSWISIAYDSSNIRIKLSGKVLNLVIYFKIRFLFLIGLIIILSPVLSFTFPVIAEARYSAIVIDSDNGKVLYSRNANTLRYPASLTKMMTLYMAFDALSQKKILLNQELLVSRRAEGQTPSKIGLKSGNKITVENAILAIISKSANDAATVLAESLAETEILFAKKMTQKAKELGMKRTNFRNATGLPNRRQKTTAKDMAILSKALLVNHKNYYHYFSTKIFKYNGKTYENHNQLLISYKGTDGIKTGYIKASGFNVAASVERDGKRLIGIVFGGKTAKTRDKHLAKLFDNAFKNSKFKNKINKPRFKPISKSIYLTKIKNTDKLKKNENNKKIEHNWLIQIGAFLNKSDAYAQIIKASQIFPSGLSDSTISITPVKSDGNILFRARMKKLPRDKAKKACYILENHGIPCNAINMSGS